MVSIPYSGETNDFGAFMRWGWTPDQFSELLCRQFDVLCRESEVSGKVMVISLHAFLIGVAHRSGALETPWTISQPETMSGSQPAVR